MTHTTADRAEQKSPRQSPISASSSEITRIRPPRGWQPVNFAELWRFRELLWFLAVRDIQVRYKQTALGAAWAVIQPLFTMIIFSVFFGYLAGIPSDGIPYPLFTLCALLPWQLFAYALTQSSNSVVAEQRLITKVYFPRLIIPIASVLSGLADFAIAFLLLLVFLIGYQIAGFGVVSMSWSLAAVPFLGLLAVAAALGTGLWLAALNVQYRDVRYTLPFLTQVWMYASPVAYSSQLVPEPWRTVYGLNPMVGIIEGFRWALLGKTELSWPLLTVSIGVVLVMLVGGMYYFRRLERSFADLV